MQQGMSTLFQRLQSLFTAAFLICLNPVLNRKRCPRNRNQPTGTPRNARTRQSISALCLIAIAALAFTNVSCAPVQPPASSKSDPSHFSAANQWADEQRIRVLQLTHDRTFLALRRQVNQLAARNVFRSNLQVRGRRLFFEIQYPRQPYPELAYRDGVRGVDHTFYRPTVNGEPVAVGAFAPNPSGTMVAVTLYLDDSEQITTIVDVATRAVYPDVLYHVNAVAWRSDNTLLFTEGSTIALHSVGHAHDAIVFARPGTTFTQVSVAANRRDILAAGTGTGSGDYVDVFLIRGSTVHHLCTQHDTVKKVHFVLNTPVVMSRKLKAHYNLFRSGARCTETIMTSSRLPMYDFFPLGSSVIAEYLDRGDSRLRLYALGGSTAGIPLQPINEPFSVNQIVPFDDGALLSVQTWHAEPVWLEMKRGSVLTIDGGAADYWKSVIDVVEVHVPTLDGTAHIPLTILRRRGASLSRNTKTILYGYGNNGWLSGPQFEGTLLAWVLDGGVYAQARIRGGGDLGRAWHVAATGKNKIRSAEDLVACARWLAKHGYGDSRHLGVYAISTGAYVAALALTQFPGTFHAAFLKSGLYDQMHLDSMELGNASSVDDIQWIRHRSPYQRLKSTNPLPALFLLHGSDDMVYSAQQSREFVERALSTHPAMIGRIFYLELTGVGHGRTDTYQDRIADSFRLQAFFSRFL